MARIPPFIVSDNIIPDDKSLHKIIIASRLIAKTRIIRNDETQ